MTDLIAHPNAPSDEFFENVKHWAQVRRREHYVWLGDNGDARSGINLTVVPVDRPYWVVTAGGRIILKGE